ncbi:MAG TPA: DUF4173 domain-containing protein [Candidatus Eisenbergiella merdipullorum]|uniref:DUF4173 domain-containing protein n=1 Tax=Candidatus Eisenbergiella merdipullorum TaxID=2838553 RepID=A0A9D2I6W2_9FIRM|nr:DUF4173 domain-containing protein [Candidatus Eisenbergiella merdipullorum]
MEQKLDQAPVQADEHRIFMRKNYAFFGGASALYALFYAFCLYRNASGITWPFFVAGTLVYFYLCTRRSGVPWKKDSIFYLVSILLLGVSIFLTDNVVINNITKAGIFLLSVSMMLHQYLDDSRWNLSKYLLSLGQGFLETIASLACPVGDGNAWLKVQGKNGKGAKSRYVLLGILILCPLLVIILALLASADLVFRELFIHLFDYVEPIDIFMVCFMIVTMFFASYSFIAMLNRRVIKEECVEKRDQEPVLAITITSVLAFVYLIFCGIQIVYLFLRKSGLPDGQSYASYARQGFFQLLAVCVINLAIVLVCLSFFWESRVLKGILTVISLCTYCMVASSAYRMLLYIGAYRLTFLRVLVLWALAVIAVMLAGILCNIFRAGFPLFRYLTAVVTVFYIVLAFAKPDYWIARYDMEYVDRESGMELTAEQREEFYEDFLYLSGLSADAVPVLASEENYKFLCNQTDSMKRYFTRMEERAEESGVRTFNLSRYLARRALEKVQDRTVS